jgi:hypothetical protein
MQQDFFYETERLLSKAGVCVIVEHHLMKIGKKVRPKLYVFSRLFENDTISNGCYNDANMNG